ncbi:MAG TPA: hypothetical protein VMT62_16340 [Syntrophorhabdaceae bacterium]|nr:hypothetical protein [Syntrophorhabdaceae bacterium]
MIAQINLTPTESKKLMAKAIAQMDLAKHALAHGMVVIHPSSSTYFLAEELSGKNPRYDNWVCGSIIPKGLCVEMGIMSSAPARDENKALDPGGFPFQVVIKGGEVSTGQPLASLLEQMGPDDLYVKGVNALDMDRNVGVLIGHHSGGGTIGKVLAAHRKKSFNIIYVAGLEKLIPTPVDEASKVLRRRDIEYAMGMVVGMVPIKGGTVISEPEAFKILAGCTAIPVAGGGIGGAEGSVTLILEGDTESVKKAVGYAEQSKGARLPQFRGRSCTGCPNADCQFPVGAKPWDL